MGQIKKYSFINYIFTLLILLTIIASSFPVTLINAEDSDNKTSSMYVGETKNLDKYTKTKLTKINSDSFGVATSREYTATVSSIPLTTDSGETIDPTWQTNTDEFGNTYYTSGVNLFSAIALTTGRVSVKNSDGLLYVWDPTISIKNKELITSLLPTILADDPINSNYHNNILSWTYTLDTGNILTKSSITVKRLVRIIEGSVMEFYTLSGNPQGDFNVSFNYKNDKFAEGKLSNAVAFDSSSRLIPLNVENNKSGFTVLASEFANKTYPVIIDPESSFTTSSYDGEVGYNSTVSYSDARQSATGSIRNSTVGVCGQIASSSPSWSVDRFMTMFNTASLPDAASITDATLYLYGYGGSAVLPDNNFNITLQSGMPTYPHMPPVASDYSYSNYSGNGGTLYTSSWSESYNALNFNSTGMSWISKTGYSKFILRSSDDINGSAPASGDWNSVTIREYSYGTGYAPYLEVTYIIPISTPTATTADTTDIGETSVTLNGYVTSDGGEDCSVRFQYGTTTAYGYQSSSLTAKGTGDYFSIPITGLTKGQTYHFRAVATNSAGSGNSLDDTFTTIPGVPTALTATAGNQQNVLAWTKGTGAQYTMVRMSTVSYPSTPGSGTTVYQNTGSGFTHTPLVEGTTYYYSAWSLTDGNYSPTYAVAVATPFYTGAPTTETRDATDVTTTEATLNGYLSATNQVGGDVTVSFDWYAPGGTWADHSASAGTLSTTGSFTADLAGLNNATLYHFRAKAVGTNGTAYGADTTFTTGAIYAPTVDTDAATGIGMTYATLNGDITDDGGASCTVYFKYGYTSGTMDQVTTSSTGVYDGIPFYYNLTGLTLNTTYYVQSIAENSIGTGYGDIISFTTSNAIAPTVTTNTALSIGSNTATLSGTVTYDGGVECEVQFEWDVDTGAAYANSTGWQTGFNTSDPITAIISGLVVGTDYFYRVSIKNANTTAYGSEQTFTTVFVEPEEFMAKSTGSTTMSLSWIPQGDQTYVTYKTNGYPVDRLDGYQAYFGTSSSFTHSTLTAGTTYFYRAWSWRTGDVWSGDYAQDAATTGSVTSSSESSTLTDITNPDIPPAMFQEPSTTKIEGIDFWYDSIAKFASEEGMPESSASMWLALGPMIGIAVIISVIAGSVTIGAVIMFVGILICSFLGIIPMWWLIIDGIIIVLYLLIFSRS